jgi:hypothetical protein
VIVGNTMSSEAEQKTGKSEGSPNVTGTHAPTLTEMNKIVATTEETKETEENLKDGVAAAEQNEDDLAVVNKSTEEGEEITPPLNSTRSSITKNEAGEDQPQEPCHIIPEEEALDPSTQPSGCAEETKEIMDEETVGNLTKETGTKQETANSLMQTTGDTSKDPMDVDSSPFDKEPLKEVLLMCASGSRCILQAAANSTKHKCPACHKAVHAICGEVDEDVCLLYKTTCWPWGKLCLERGMSCLAP